MKFQLLSSVPLLASASFKMVQGYSVGKPSFSVVAPGNCQFGDDWASTPLKKVEQISADTKVFTFATPDTSTPLNLPTCGCMLAQGGADAEGNAFIRPYTPVSTNSMVGEFELMVKIYPEGNLSQHMNTMKVGDSLNFKHIKFNVKKQYPFGVANVAMLVGGTGITPMVQALHAILGNPEDNTKVNMLYGSQVADQILAEQVLADWQAAYPDQLSVTHVLSGEPQDSAWTGERGFITEDLMAKHFPGPKEDLNIFVCGPPPMYNALCGAREEAELSGVLAGMGYTAEQVTKF